MCGKRNEDCQSESLCEKSDHYGPWEKAGLEPTRKVGKRENQNVLLKQEIRGTEVAGCGWSPVPVVSK